MSDPKILTDKHKGWKRVWDLIVSKRGASAIDDYKYIHTINDTHVFRHKTDTASLKWLYAAIRPDDFDVPTGKRVKCTETGGSSRLVLGKVYDVLEESPSSYMIRDEEGVGGWYKDRFEVVGTPQPPEMRELQEETTPLQSEPPPFDWDTYNGYKKRK